MLIALVTFGVLSTLLVCVIFLGIVSPETGVRASRIVVAAPPERVWAVIADHAAEPAWRKDLRAVERLPDSERGEEVWREAHFRGPPLTLRTLERIAPSGGAPGRLVRALRLERFLVDGRWEIVVETGEGGTLVTITEFAVTESPFARFFGLLPGADRFLRLYLTSLAGALGEQPRFLAAPKPPYTDHASAPTRWSKKRAR